MWETQTDRRTSGPLIVPFSNREELLQYASRFDSGPLCCEGRGMTAEQLQRDLDEKWHELEMAHLSLSSIGHKPTDQDRLGLNNAIEAARAYFTTLDTIRQLWLVYENGA